MKQLVDLTARQKPHLGAAVNVDGDRVAFVTQDAVALSEEVGQC